MAYPYYPQNYQQPSFIAGWAQGGEVGAISYPVNPGQTAILLDSERDRFYLKIVDASGVPAPLRVFDFKEVTGAPAPKENYVTREEFEKFVASMKKEEKTDG